MEDKLVDIFKKYGEREALDKLNALGMTDNKGNVDRTYEEISTKQGEDDDERDIWSTT